MFSVLWNKLKRDEQGFTLVELLIVIIILGVLATIGIPTYRGFVDRAHEAATLAELQAVSMAIKFYFIEKGETETFDVQLLKRYLGDDLTDSGEYLGTYTLTFVKADESNADYIEAKPNEGVKDRCSAKIYVQSTANIKRGEIEIEVQ